MEAIAYPVFVPVADYLSGEEASEVRHEYLGGEVHAMAGGTIDHNLLAGNLTSPSAPTCAANLVAPSWRT